MRMGWLLAAGALAFASSGQSGSTQHEKSSAQVIRDGSFELNTTADKALQFFTPEGERSWVNGWDPKPVYPEQTAVAFQANAVFRVDDSEEQSLWTIVEANEREHIAEYVYVVSGRRLSRVRVEVEPLGGNRCRVHVHYVHTAISNQGLPFLATVSEEAFAQKMVKWHSMVGALIQ